LLFRTRAFIKLVQLLKKEIFTTGTSFPVVRIGVSSPHGARIRPGIVRSPALNQATPQKRFCKQFMTTRCSTLLISVCLLSNNGLIARTGSMLLGALDAHGTSITEARWIRTCDFRPSPPAMTPISRLWRPRTATGFPAPLPTRAQNHLSGAIAGHGVSAPFRTFSRHLPSSTGCGESPSDTARFSSAASRVIAISTFGWPEILPCGQFPTCNSREGGSTGCSGIFGNSSDYTHVNLSATKSRPPPTRQRRTGKKCRCVRRKNPGVCRVLPPGNVQAPLLASDNIPGTLPGPAAQHIPLGRTCGGPPDFPLLIGIFSSLTSLVRWFFSAGSWTTAPSSSTRGKC